ncbi:MAG TPA: YciI family protein [Gemmatimonadaceae bacterium]|nr:YciI family protein [Gemmatimonadaceae bacterium]
MRFMLMMHAPRGADGEYQVDRWAPEEFRAHIDFMHRLNAELTQRGELVGAEGLAPPGQARLVRAARDGGPPVTDGPFAEAKEFLAGYWLVDVESAERAYAIAAQASAAPGPGGAPLRIPIEVRQVMSAPAPTA